METPAVVYSDVIVYGAERDRASDLLVAGSSAVSD
jgi:hypothetical protein